MLHFLFSFKGERMHLEMMEISFAVAQEMNETHKIEKNETKHMKQRWENESIYDATKSHLGLDGL